MTIWNRGFGRRAGFAWGFALSVLLWTQVVGADVIRRDLGPSVKAVSKPGRSLGLELHPPKGNSAKSFLQRYLIPEKAWTPYRNLSSVFIPFDYLNAESQRT
jgi:hypothetical protein